MALKNFTMFWANACILIWPELLVSGSSYGLQCGETWPPYPSSPVEKKIGRVLSMFPLIIHTRFICVVLRVFNQQFHFNDKATNQKDKNAVKN